MNFQLYIFRAGYNNHEQTTNNGLQQEQYHGQQEDTTPAHSRLQSVRGCWKISRRMCIALCEGSRWKCHVPHITQPEMSSVWSMRTHGKLLQDIHQCNGQGTDQGTESSSSYPAPACKGASPVLEQIRDSRITGSRGGTSQRTTRYRVSTTRSQTGTFAPVNCDKNICNLYLGKQSQKSPFTLFTAFRTRAGAAAAAASQTHKASRNCSLVGRLLRNPKKKTNTALGR